MIHITLWKLSSPEGPKTPLEGGKRRGNFAQKLVSPKMPKTAIYGGQGAIPPQHIGVGSRENSMHTYYMLDTTLFSLFGLFTPSYPMHTLCTFVAWFLPPAGNLVCSLFPPASLCNPRVSHVSALYTPHCSLHCDIRCLAFIDCLSSCISYWILKYN